MDKPWGFTGRAEVIIGRKSMGRSRITGLLFILSAAALIAAPGGFSATPQEIYSDYADNGRLDNTYTPADLERVLKNAAVQQYGTPGTGGLKPAVEEEIDDSTSGGTTAGAAPGTTGGTSGGTLGGTAGGQTGGGTSPVQSSGGLPFTGLDLSLIAAGALGLILLGAALRRVARQKA
jgi:hypothetical protein